MDKYRHLRQEREQSPRNPCCYDRLGNAKVRWTTRKKADAVTLKHRDQEVYECEVILGTFHVRKKRR